MITHLVEYGACLFLLAAISVWIDRHYPILRDFPAGGRPVPGALSYSLGRVQMALWTVIVIASIVYGYWLMDTGRGNFPAIDPGIVGLLGISGATGVLSGFVDVTKDKAVENARASFAETGWSVSSLDAQILAALTKRGPTGQLAPNIPAIQRLMQEKADRIGELSQQRVTVSRSQRDSRSGGFVSDLLSDQNGNSLHRLQLMLFTVVFAIYFICHVAVTGDLNISFSQQMLGLLGVSSGVYVGFKVPGKAA